MFYTYILINKDASKTYTGCTANLEGRLLEHNSGKNKSSKSYGPFEIAYYESFLTLKEAREKEKSTSQQLVEEN